MMIETYKLKPDQKTLDVAAVLGNKELVYWFIDRFALTPTEDTIEAARKSGNEELLQCLQETQRQPASCQQLEHDRTHSLGF